jgi:hypothetical protein
MKRTLERIKKGISILHPKSIHRLLAYINSKSFAIDRTAELI